MTTFIDNPTRNQVPLPEESLFAPMSEPTSKKEVLAQWDVFLTKALELAEHFSHGSNPQAGRSGLPTTGVPFTGGDPVSLSHVHGISQDGIYDPMSVKPLTDSDPDSSKQTLSGLLSGFSLSELLNQFKEDYDKDITDGKRTGVVLDDSSPSWVYQNEGLNGGVKLNVENALDSQKPAAEPEDKFSISKESLDPFTLIMMLQEERAGLIESQVRDQSKRMEDINTEIKGMGNLLGQVNTASSGLDKGSDKTNIDDALRQELMAAGIDVPGGEVSKDQLNAMAETLKSKRDGLNNDSQMEMIRLQGLVNKQQQAYQLMSTIQKKEHELLMSIIRNVNS